MTVGRIYYIRQKRSGKYLDTQDGDVTGSNIQQYVFNGTGDQMWKVEDAGDGYVKLLSQAGTKTRAIDIADGVNAEGTNIRLYEDDNTNAQKFRLSPVAGGGYQLLSKTAEDKRCMMVSAGNAPNDVFMSRANVYLGTGAETEPRSIWYFEPADEGAVSDDPMAGKTYRFRVRHSGQYLVPSGHSLDAGTMLKQYYASLYLTEEYLLDFAEYTNNTFWYYLKPMNHVEVCVDTGSVQSDGYIHPVLQNTGTQDSMKFRLVPVGTGYALVSKTGYILGVKLADYADAADIVAETAPGTFSTSTVGEHQILVLEEVSKFVSSGVSYTSDGRNIASTRDARSKQTSFTYDSSNRLLSYVTDPNGHSIHYSYDPDTDQVTEVSASVSDGTGTGTRSVVYTYDSADRLKTINHNGTIYTYDYDGFGNLLSVKVGTTQAGTVILESYEYFPGNGPLKKVTYGNGAAEEYLYDNEERLIGRKWNHTQTVSYTYDADGNLETEKDLLNLLTRRTRYDSTGRLVRLFEEEGTGASGTGALIQALELGYDSHNRVDTLVQKLNDQKIRTTYLYGDPEQQELPGKPYGLKIDGTRRQTLTYDKLLRKTQEVVHLPGSDPENSTRYHTYEYGTNVNAVRTDMLLTYMTNDTDSYGYTYDNAGNISSITVNGTQVISYTYDELNQLIREDNAVLNKTITYMYDLGGNMTSRKEYAYTAGTLGTPTKTDTFTYGNTDWKDQLTAYNGVGITYDGSGNPLSYRGMTMTWQKGRQLAAIIKDGTTTSFTYDSRGHRIRKTSGTGTGGAVSQTITRYFYNGDTLIGLVKGNQTVQFVYDTEGRPFLMRVYTENNTTPADYYYLYNGQGDVTGLIDSSNHDIVHYSYDSWGKMVSVTDTSDASISTLNPFRYRGYIYDPETELYYLGSRYYDAGICRFISPDDHEYLRSKRDQLYELNIYSYCDNEPIIRLDVGGSFWLEIGLCVGIGAVGAIISGAVTYASQKLFGEEINKGSIIVSAVAGFVSGVIAATPLAVSGQMIANCIIGGASYVADNIVNDRETTFIGLTVSSVVGAFCGRIGGDGANVGHIITNAYKQAVKVEKHLGNVAIKATEKWASKRIISYSTKFQNVLVKQTSTTIARFTAGSLVYSTSTPLLKKAVSYLLNRFVNRLISIFSFAQ